MANHFIREWRKHREMTQEDLSGMASVGRSYLAQIERGERQYDQKLLEKLAVALRCTPADLIARAPDAGQSIDALLETVDESEKARIAAAIRALIGMPE